MAYNVGIVSGIQQNDSVIHIHTSIHFQILFPFMLLYDIEYTSLCYIVGPHSLSAVYMGSPWYIYRASLVTEW